MPVCLMLCYICGYLLSAEVERQLPLCVLTAFCTGAAACRSFTGHYSLRKAIAAQIFLDTFPQLVGTRFGDLVFRFSDGLVLGLLNRRSGACDIAPPADTLVSPSPPATGCA